MQYRKRMLRKKGTALLLSALLLASALPLAAYAEEVFAKTTEYVNFRSGPGTNYKKLGKLRRGQTVAVWSITGKWAEITWTGNQKGYVHTDYLRMDAE